MQAKVVVRMHEYMVSEAAGIRRNFRKSGLSREFNTGQVARGSTS
jgi:hypothetical protein